jgi:tRNA-specific 2-thiouridylase
MSVKPRVIVALSGGVDSAVAALLLKRAGHDVECLHMSNWEDDGYCDSAAEFQDARRVADQLGVPLHRVSFALEYKEQVFRHFVAEHEAGRTPNPDVLCNSEIKFGVLARYAERLGGERLATGHYARLARSPAGEIELLKGADPAKDQSYFLHAVDAHDFANVLFPLGKLLKAEVRQIAEGAGLAVSHKKDSTGICFIGERPFAEFLSRYVRAVPGPLRTLAGDTVGEHAGLSFYTIGQRHGLGIGGRPGGDESPWYVAAKDCERNALIVVQGRDHPALYADTLVASRAHWIGTSPLAGGAAQVRCAAKARYRQADQPCTVHTLPRGELEIVFDRPQRALAPGQYVVLYSGQRCLGGATIERVAARTEQRAVQTG